MSMLSDDIVWQLWVPGGPTLRGRDAIRADIERQTVDHDAIAEANDEIANTNGDSFSGHRYIPIEAKKIANRPSSTITRKIDFTTEAVV